MRVLLLLAASATLLADGGGVVAQKNSGALRVTVFANPLPLRAGAAEIAVLVEAQQTFAPVTDARVRMTARSPEGKEITLELLTSRAIRGLYACGWDIAANGEWMVRIAVERGGIRTEVPARITVMSAAEPIRSFIAVIALTPIGIALFALNRFLRWRQAIAE